jgi:hypothetical protein
MLILEELLMVLQAQLIVLYANFGGSSTAATGVTEFYDGTSWTELADLATAEDNTSGLGSGSLALCSGGW